jgi:hypothetical protein
MVVKSSLGCKEMTKCKRLKDFFGDTSIQDK